MSLTRTFAALALSLTIPRTAMAAEWRYCLALSREEHRVYMSTPFPTSATMAAVEAAFDRTLTLSRLRHDEVQCPRSDNEQSALIMQQQASRYNRSRDGSEITNLNWKP
jgi:hypothetical protein